YGLSGQRRNALGHPLQGRDRPAAAGGFSRRSGRHQSDCAARRRRPDDWPGALALAAARTMAFSSAGGIRSQTRSRVMSASFLKKLAVLTGLLVALWVFYLYKQVPHQSAPFEKAAPTATGVLLQQGAKKVQLSKINGEWKVQISTSF